MNFTLREKTKKEIAKAEKGTNKKVCPIEVTMASGRKVDAWNLKETEIISLIKSNLNEGFVDGQRFVWSEQIIKCWGDKHTKLTANFYGEAFKMLENNIGVQKQFVNSLFAPIIVNNTQIAEARKQAEREKGKNDDFSAVSRDEILEELKETERQELAKVLQTNKTV